MEGFTIIDAVVAGIIVISALLAYSRGLVREAMAIAGWIGATVLAFIFAPQVQPLLCLLELTTQAARCRERESERGPAALRLRRLLVLAGQVRRFGPRTDD